MAISRVRSLLLDEFDPTAGVCALVLARFVDVPPLPPVSRDDLLQLAAAALDSGQAPLGPLEYAHGEVTNTVREFVPTRIVTMADGDEITLKLGLALGDAGCIGMGGTRYGHLPVARSRSTSAAFLPDVEAGLAEMIVYARERAHAIAYSGRVDVALELHCAEPILPCTVDPESGRAVLGAPLVSFEPISFTYSFDMPEGRIQSRYYDAACELARCFGVDAPQFLTPQFLRQELLEAG